MAEDHDRTMQIVTNLDRAGIDQKIGQARQTAEALGLADVKSVLTGAEGKSAKDTQEIINRAVAGLIGKPEYGRLQDLLELIELNLKNIG